ncbi:hypothetical protein K1T71_010636 [Dendrolimus kikuchii]|uniref:Uncharacterized protein n=1 Tax=Dendrolimus kikuchii TaxID=765133 RepID=A0ACC1CPU5_9NEOP|nr:hypothetical protein K1T71_010636 [Dendrolimus kikuchii]
MYRECLACETILLLLVIWPIMKMALYTGRTKYFKSFSVNNVRLVNHQGYVIEVIQKTVETLERNGWCNLKLPDIESAINETVIDWEAIGTQTFTNGFLVSIQHVDIVQSTVQQIWNWRVPGSVDVQGRLRMHNVVVGYDVKVQLTEGDHTYSVTYMHPLVNFDFSIVRDLNNDTIAAAVTGVTPNSNNMPNFLPKDDISDMLTTLYVRTNSNAGVNAWGADKFQPILENIITNVVDFPTENTMLRYFVFYFISFTFISGQWVERSRVIDFADYYEDLIQETIYEVERRGFCNFKLDDLSQTLNEQMYSWLVNGTVQYTNGYVVSIQQIVITDIAQSVGNRFVGDDRVPFAVVRGRLHLRAVRVGFDVLVEIQEGVFRTTGVFEHSNIQYQIEIAKNMISKELSTASSVVQFPGAGGNRMIYHPANNITEVLSRRYTPGSNSNSAAVWGRTIIAPIMLEIAKEKLPFPKVCFNSNCQ